MAQSRWAVLRRVDWRVDLLGVSIVYLVEGMLDMASLAVSYYCKDNLRLGPADAGLFQTAGQIPWELTPLLGLLTDLVPICGYRRRAYLLLVGAVGSACWGALAALSGCPAWLAACLLVGSAACTAWTQVIADAVLVGMSQGASQDVATFYQGLSWVTYTSGAVVSAYATGRALDAVGPRPVFALAACGLLVDGACAALVTEERRRDGRSQGSAGGAGGGGHRAGDKAGREGFVGQPSGYGCEEQTTRKEEEVEEQRVVAGTGAEEDGDGDWGIGYGVDTDAVPAHQGLMDAGAACSPAARPPLARTSSPLPPLPLPAAQQQRPQQPQLRKRQQLQRYPRPDEAALQVTAQATCRALFAGDAEPSPLPGATPAGAPASEAAGSGAATPHAVPPGGGAAGQGLVSSAWLEQPWGSPLEGELTEPLLFKTTDAGGSAGSGCGGASVRSQGADMERAGPSQGGVAGLVATVWRTLRDPHILVPALFIFLWQSCPSPSSAMFYFQFNTLHFTAEFQEVVYLAGSFAGVAGVMLYQAFLIRYSLRSMLLWCALLGTSLSATQLLLVTRANLRLGISDKIFVLGDYAVLKAIAEVMMTPLLALSARVCPPGVEATLYACLYSVLNLSVALSGALGALLTSACGVSSDGSASASPGSLTRLVALCTGSMLLPLPLLAFMPAPQPQPQCIPEPAGGGREGQLAKAAAIERGWGSRPGLDSGVGLWPGASPGDVGRQASGSYLPLPQEAIVMDLPMGPSVKPGIAEAGLGGEAAGLDATPSPELQAETAITWGPDLGSQQQLRRSPEPLRAAQPEAERPVVPIGSDSGLDPGGGCAARPAAAAATAIATAAAAAGGGSRPSCVMGRSQSAHVGLRASSPKPPTPAGRCPATADGDSSVVISIGSSVSAPAAAPALMEVLPPVTRGPVPRGLRVCWDSTGSAAWAACRVLGLGWRDGR